MCVIMAADATRPSPNMVEAGFDGNPAGAGVAWREGGKVQWEKGLMNLEDAQKCVLQASLPLVVHFRIPTAGGDELRARKALTHPFEVSRKTSDALMGATKNYLLFHNGHWGPFRMEVKDTASKTGIPIPHGHWSDSKAMAWVASCLGIGILDFINEKVVLFGPTGDMLFFGGPWHMCNNICVSNLGFEHRLRSLDNPKPKSELYHRDTAEGVVVSPLSPERPRIVHPYKCGCRDCAKSTNLTARGTDAAAPFRADTAFQEAVENFRQAEWSRSLPKTDTRRISKNAWKRAQRTLQNETRRVTLAYQRQQAKLTLPQCELTH